VQLEQEATARALATARAATRDFPRGAAAWTLQAEAEAKSGAFEDAARSLAEAERLNPDHERLPLVRALLAREAPPR
jgi:cytochrome c-type biogenesis protein CcmH/NrfG